ncbi:MAG: glycosyltransferase, partial [Moraxellaceae bacterium]
MRVSVMSTRLTEMGVSYELIFADDGSSDNSLEIIKSLAAENKEVKFLSLSRN